MGDKESFAGGIVIGSIGTMILLVVMISVFEAPEDRLRKEAVEVGAAYWCIEDHERVFSWNECEE